MRTILPVVAILGLLAGCVPTPPSALPISDLLPASASPASPLPTSEAPLWPAIAPSPTPLPPAPAGPNAPPPSGDRAFTFAITADMRLYSGPGVYDTPRYFRGACEAIATHGPALMVSPGDVDPPEGVLWTITRTLGADFPWYPAVGNHEVETPEDMDWLRRYGASLTAPDGTPVRPGPPGCPTTTYAFDYENAHFVILNLYCDAAGDAVTDGDIPDHLYRWLASDLAATDRAHVFVFGHEPAYPQPDAHTGRKRHMEDSLNAHPARRDRFWNLLRERGVRAYICGHTHNYSAIQVDSVWQLDVGHARGMGDPEVPSTFILVRVDGPSVVFETYRDFGSGYVLADSGVLAVPFTLYLPAVQHAVP
ncbi:MAG: metallophosphoesterase family protein [Anaerolineae bacterium]